MLIAIDKNDVDEYDNNKHFRYEQTLHLRIN